MSSYTARAHLDKYLQLQATVDTVRSQVAPPLLITSVCHTHCATLLRSAMLPEYVSWESVTTLICISVNLFVVIYFVNKAQLDSADCCSVARREAAAGCLLRTVRPCQASASGGRAAYPRSRTITTALDTTKSNLTLSHLLTHSLIFIISIISIISMYLIRTSTVYHHETTVIV